MDSGVWLASDESMMSVGEDGLALPLSDDMVMEEEDDDDNNVVHGSDVDVQPGDGGTMMRMASLSATSQVRAVFRLVQEPEEHQLARQIVADCLDKGQDSIDLR